MNNHFFVVGAQRSGTTYIYQLLDAHPDICMAKPLKPEPKFFLKHHMPDYSYQDYFDTYFDDGDYQLYGEKSTSYIESELAAQQIASWFEPAKIIMILRNPIERAVSNYYFSRKHNLETLPIDEAFMQESDRRDNYDRTKISASPYAYLQRGHYIRYIEMYEQFFLQEQIKILIHEEFVGQPTPIRQLYQWLGVNADVDITQNLNAVNATNKTKSTLSASLQDYLVNHFAESISQLENYMGRSLSIWQPKKS